ncbi:NAD(P)/FAD-dependent oxidoreductase [Pedococcus sp. P5_B7]
MSLRRRAPDVVVIGAGALGAAVAWLASRAGLVVDVVERGPIVSGTTSACEGNLLVSDKEAGPELDLALYSWQLWRDELAEFADLWEFEEKGGLVVATSEESARALLARSQRQRAAGIDVRTIGADDVHTYEPHLTREVHGAALYPQDCQVQPILMAAHFLRMARELGARVRTGTTVTGMLWKGGRVIGVRTDRGQIFAANVVNAAGPWAGEIAALAGVLLPVLPRRGFVLVTEPLPPTIFHKVYAADYIASTQNSDTALHSSTVIEATHSGTVLIGSTRERVGFDQTVSLPALKELSRKALGLFPAMQSVCVIRCYLGFRPYCPDHLPALGIDEQAPGLLHATGHEGAGIGLSVGSAKLLVQTLLGERPDLDLRPFAPNRFS